MLAWLMNMGFAGGAAVDVVEGPYQIETGHAYVSGGDVGQEHIAGGDTGHVYISGGDVGQKNG